MRTRAPARGTPLPYDVALQAHPCMGGAFPSRIRGMVKAAGALALPQTFLPLTLMLMGRPSRSPLHVHEFPPLLSPFFNWCILSYLWTDILGAWTDEPVVGVLLQDVRGPTRRATTGKDGRIQVDGNTKRVID